MTPFTKYINATASKISTTTFIAHIFSSFRNSYYKYESKFQLIDTPSSLKSYLVPYKSLYDHSYFANLKWNYSKLT